MNIMIIGNSHSIDTFWLLRDVFADQMPDQEVVLGIMYYSGCPIDKHIQFHVEQQPVYDYHRNIGGTWETMSEVMLEHGLKDQAWDYVFMQAGRSDLDDTLNLDGRRNLEKIISEYVHQPYKLGWQNTWTSPNDPTFYAPDFDPQPPSGYLEYLQTNYGMDLNVQYTKSVNRVTANIVGDETYDKAIAAGAGVMYAHMVLGVPQTDLWRDYTHLSDYGRLLAAYSFYAQFTGNPVTKVGIDSIPADQRVRRARVLGDLIVTEEMKQVIIDATAHALEDPWFIPANPQ